MSKPIRFEGTRRLALKVEAIDRGRRIIPGASLSSENPVRTQTPLGAVDLILSHQRGAVDLPESLPLLWAHDMKTLIGRAENLRLDGDKLRADLRFSENSRAKEVWQDIVTDFLSDTSIHFVVGEYEEEDNDTIRATRWALDEASIVATGADSTVGLQRSKLTAETANMSENTQQPDKDKGNHADTAPNSGADVVISFEQARTAGYQAGSRDAIAGERARYDAIEGLFSGERYQSLEFQALKRELQKGGHTIEQAREALLVKVGASSAEPVGGDFDQSRMYRAEVTPGKTDMEKFCQGMTRALDVRLGLEKDDKIISEVRAHEFASMSVPEMARDYLRRQNLPLGGLSREQLIGAAFTHGFTGQRTIAHSSSDFSNVLENIASKSLLAGWTEAPESWETWTRQGSLPDFKQATRTGISAFSDLDIVYEDGEYKHGTFTDLKEYIQLVTYGKLFTISRQALANDDLGALSMTPMKMGRAASRVIGDQVYGTLYSNSGVGPTLNQDSTALFNTAGHNNYVSSSGAAPSVATLNTAETAMSTQTDPSGNAILNIEPAYLIVPRALANTSRVLIASTYDPAGTAGTLTPNPFSGRLTVVAEGRLDADSATAWYVAANQSMWDTIEVAFYNGMRTPYLEQRQGWTVDGTEYKVRIDAAVAALDFRGLYKNVGT